MPKEEFIDIKKGLTQKEVEERVEKNLVNYDTSAKTKTVKQIVAENIVTLFNIINLILAGAVILVGSFKNLAFMGIIICNTLISIFQQLRSKKTLDKLQVVSESKIKVRRDGEDILLSLDKIVKDDIISLVVGNQVVVDSIIREGFVEVDESFVTGEADTVIKKVGDLLLSGSFIVGGSAICQVKNVGKDNYTAKIATDTKYIKPVSSEIMRSLNKIVRTISIFIVPIAILLFYRQLYLEDNNVSNAVINTTAAIIGMIPEGLVLLTSTVLAVSVYILSKRQVLVQDLYCIETLARVDVLCLDKTGTITEGKMEVVGDESLTDEDVGRVALFIAQELNEENPTAGAIRKYYQEALSLEVREKIVFSSKRKYSGVELVDGSVYVMGSPEFVLRDEVSKYQKKITEYSINYRLLVVAKAKDKNLKNVEVLGFIFIQDKIRENAKATLDYFQKQGVTLKIISGDNPLTVKSIAKRAGFPDGLKEIDATTLKTEQDIMKAVLEYDIFGRVTPEQKRDFVIALQNHSHTVAMTGDGVNDVLALKEADCSVAMASGSDATKNVSQLVLLDSDFSSMPSIVEEGRRTINNIERSSSLFLVKTIYASILALIFIFLEVPYPFIPIQLTLASISTIGIPSFMLSFEANHERVRGKFLPNVLKRSLPAALTIVFNILLITAVSSLSNLEYAQTSTISVFMTGFVTFMLLYTISKPFNIFRKILFVSMFSIFIFGFIFLKDIFSFASINLEMMVIIVVCVALSYFLYHFFNKKVGDYFIQVERNRKLKLKKILKKQENA